MSEHAAQPGKAPHTLFRWTAAILFAAQTLSSIVDSLAGTVDGVGRIVVSLVALFGTTLAG